MGRLIPLYCIDLPHENAVGDSYALNPWSSPSFSTSSDPTPPIESPGPSRMAVSPASTPLPLNCSSGRLLDNGFSVINWNGNTALQATYNNLVRELCSPSSGYNPNGNYQPGVEF